MFACSTSPTLVVLETWHCSLVPLTPRFMEANASQIIYNTVLFRPLNNDWSCDQFTQRWVISSRITWFDSLVISRLVYFFWLGGLLKHRGTSLLPQSSINITSYHVELSIRQDAVCLLVCEFRRDQWLLLWSYLHSLLIHNTLEIMLKSWIRR